MQRVMIVGGPGSGKSTLARRLGALTGLPVHHMDRIQWLPGWVNRSWIERQAMAVAVESGGAWIFEGGFSATWDNRLRRCDTLIWLDLPVGLRLWRVTWRLLRYWGRERPDMAPGCREGWHRGTLAFYGWIWNTRASGRSRIAALIARAPGQVAVVHLSSRRAVAAYLHGIGGGAC